MNQIQIIGAIMLATGKSVEESAKELFNCSKPTIYRVIRGASKTPHIRSKIADLIGKPVADIWPEQAKEGKTE